LKFQKKQLNYKKQIAGCCTDRLGCAEPGRPGRTWPRQGLAGPGGPAKAGPGWPGLA